MDTILNIFLFFYNHFVVFTNNVAPYFLVVAVVGMVYSLVMLYKITKTEK